MPDQPTPAAYAPPHFPTGEPAVRTPGDAQPDPAPTAGSRRTRTRRCRTRRLARPRRAASRADRLSGAAHAGVGHQAFGVVADVLGAVGAPLRGPYQARLDQVRPGQQAQTVSPGARGGRRPGPLAQLA